MKNIIIWGLIMGLASMSHAQTITVKDSETNTPLEAVQITSQSPKAMASTNINGQANIEAFKDSQQIFIQFLGFKTLVMSFKKLQQQQYQVYLDKSNVNLDEVEILATINKSKSQLETPKSVTNLEPVELNRGTGLFLDDAININVPGVTMNRRAVASGQQFNIRGYGNGARGTNGVSSNFDGQGYKVYLNGIPVTDAEGITVMDDIDFGSLGSVKVTKGPSGTLHGLAIAGAVELTTRTPNPGQTSIGQQVTLGSYGLQRYTTSFQTAGDRASLMVNYGKQYSYGYMAHTESTKDFVNLVAAFQPSQKQSVNLYVGYSNSYDQRGGELTIDQYNNGDYSGNPAYIKNNAHSKLVGFRAGISHQYNFSSQWSNTTTVFGSGFNGNASSAGGWTDKSPINYGLRSVINTNYKFNDGMALTGITGIETQHQYNPLVSYRMTANPSDPDGYNVIGNLKGNKMITTGTTALFTQWSLALPSDWLLTAGLGLSDMKIQLEDRMYDSNSTNPTVYKSKYIGLVSPHVAINKILSDKVSIYASYSKGYKAPVSSYFYIPYTGEVNKDLKSEIGNQFEIGSKGNLFEDRLSYQLALYHVKFSNKMTAVAVPVEGDPSATAYSYMVNGGSQVHKGLETQLKYKLYNSNTNFIKALSPFANLTYTDFKYKNFGIQKSATVFEDYSRNAVAGVARLTTNLGLDIITKHGVYASATYSYKDGVPITSDGKFRAHSFALLNAKVGINHIISNHWVLDASFGLNNITSTHYYYMVFVNQLPDAYLPAPNKINYFGGISLKYNL